MNLDRGTGLEHWGLNVDVHLAVDKEMLMDLDLDM